ncbi:MAG: Gfo/Idh/MocA family oxidoreductase [Planctomycetota bacterium]|nr:Gfo/Idh/MocA family oxidoreductase [Planctomycetota bacterium]
MLDHTNRREFLQDSTGIVAATTTTAALSAAPAFASSASETINLGIIGCGGIMSHHVQGLVGRKENVSLNFLCDVDPRQIERMRGFMGSFQKAEPTRTKKYEDVIANKNVDAVIIATPHHWHAPIAIAAMREGKDVYIEKPISHVYNEGHAIIEAAKKYGRVVQQGSQMRNSEVTNRARKLIDDGAIGEIKVARAWTAETRNLVKPVPDSTPPSGVDYDRWLGPAPKHAFNRYRFHGTWRMFQDYANGEIGDDGIHDLDMACWGLGVKTVPQEITARGGRMLLHGHASDYPDNMNVTYEYPDGRLLIYENYPFTAYGLHGFDNGNAFYGTDGYMIFSRRGAFSVFLGPKGKPGPTEGRDVRGQRGYAEHMAEFLNAVRTRNLKTRANAETAHLSCALVHFGEIAYRTNGRIQFDDKTQSFVDCDAANGLLGKTYRDGYGLPKV